MLRKPLVFTSLILFLILSLYFQSLAFAEDKINLIDNIIGSTFKALAKTFVATADIERLKKINIAKLNEMEEEKFKKRYAKVHEVIKSLPPKLKVSYEISKGMTKEQAIKNIESLNKKNIYMVIDSLPDTIIAQQFKQYLSEKRQAIQKSNIVEQINKFWNKMIGNVNLSAPKVKEQFK